MLNLREISVIQIYRLFLSDGFIKIFPGRSGIVFCLAQPGTVKLECNIGYFYSINCRSISGYSSSICF